MRLSFFGAARTVTGSQFLLEVNGKQLLIDCGMYQGKRSEAYARNLYFPFNPRKVDAVLLTHAHIDHSGNLPNLIKQGYEGPIYATPASCDLADLMLRDSGRIQEADAEFVNKKRAEKGEPPVEPLYTQDDAEHVVEHLAAKDYDERFQPVTGVTARLVDAGHILGSSSVELEVEEAGGKKTRLWFSGDIGRRNLPILRDPVLPENIDYLIMESTYGDKIHRDPGLAYEELYQVTMETIRRRGKVIIPSFAVGRTQEIVYGLNQFVSEGRMPSIPVYVDSPLAVNASDVFARHPECYDDETRKFVAQYKHPALEFSHLTYIRTVEESKALNHKDGPMIIISASGMAETGRILHHLKNNIEDSRNMILIVSWQAPDTLGRRLADRAQRVRIFGEEYIRRAGVSTIGGLSGHAGQDMLVNYAKSAAGGSSARGGSSASGGNLKHVFLVHGETVQAGALTKCLAGVGLGKVSYPELNSSVEL
jgi:metallo-beta-lactamase family protein